MVKQERMKKKEIMETFETVLNRANNLRRSKVILRLLFKQRIS